MHELLQRLLRRGPKYGISRGIAVLASPGSDSSPMLNDVLGPSKRFTAWARGHGVTLTSTPASLADLDGHLELWQDTEFGPSLGNDVALYLGQVIVQNVSSAEWTAWPNGHPVVRLGSGQELDVVEIVSQRLSAGQPRLTTVFEQAERS